MMEKKLWKLTFSVYPQSPACHEPRFTPPPPPGKNESHADVAIADVAEKHTPAHRPATPHVISFD